MAEHHASAQSSDDEDSLSVFAYDDEESTSPDSFSLTKLQTAASRFWKTHAVVHKLAEGGYHKVYDVRTTDGKSLGIARVASPAFPVDKLASEVATLRYLRAKTCIPVPEVFHFEQSTLVIGAEYMLMEKLPGKTAAELWPTLSLKAKCIIVNQIGLHFCALFQCRFSQAGSLYQTPSGDFYVGPIVSTPFYRALDGLVRFPTNPPDLQRFRGPFDCSTAYLRSSIEAELACLQSNRAEVLLELDGDEEKLKEGRTNMIAALALCNAYPKSETFSFCLDDFRLSNIILDQSTLKLTALIDFEGTTIAPLWQCATIPRWLQDPSDAEGCYEGGAPQERNILRNIYGYGMANSRAGTEWWESYACGRRLRSLTDRLTYQVGVWTCLGKWVDDQYQAIKGM